MIIDELLKLNLDEILENYCLLYSPECGYYYGIAECNDVDKLYEEYNIDEYSEAFEPDTIIPGHIMGEINDKLLTYDLLENIMNNLDITKKNNNGDTND